MKGVEGEAKVEGGAGGSFLIQRGVWIERRRLGQGRGEEKG